MTFFISLIRHKPSRETWTVGIKYDVKKQRSYLYTHNESTNQKWTLIKEDTVDSPINVGLFFKDFNDDHRYV